MMRMAPSRARAPRSERRPTFGITQVMKHASADDLIECLAKLVNPFDRKLVEPQIIDAMFLLKITRMAQA